MTDPCPKIAAPGLTWRKLKHGWECRWRAREDLVRRGYIPKSVRLFHPTPEAPVPGPFAVDWITKRANVLQDDMLNWGRGNIEAVATYEETWSSLIACYKTDPDSAYHVKRYSSRQHTDTLCRRVEKDCGSDRVDATDARRVKRLYEGWVDGGKIATGSAMVGMLRTLTTFGATLLKCPACRELKMTLHDMRFKGSKPREERLTADMVEDIRKLAPGYGRRSLALAQAFQFDLMLRQKDVIGEWVPLSEPGPPSDIIDRNEKWLRGIRWEEIDQHLILRHITSKRQKAIDPDLTLAPMVMVELRFKAGIGPDDILRRDMLPASGPVIVNEMNDLPWRSPEFRRVWRAIATACGIPKNIRNMDSRAGAISEATDAGAELEHVRHAATHSDISMTQRYSRGTQDKVAKVMKLRAEHRVKRT